MLEEVDENGLRLKPALTLSDSARRSLDARAFQALAHLQAACLAVRGLGLHSAGDMAINLYGKVEAELRAEAFERHNIELTNLPGRPPR